MEIEKEDEEELIPVTNEEYEHYLFMQEHHGVELDEDSHYYSMIDHADEQVKLLEHTIYTLHTKLVAMEYQYEFMMFENSQNLKKAVEAAASHRTC